MRLKKVLFMMFIILLPVFYLATSSAVVSAQVDISSDVCDGEGGSGDVPSICKDIKASESTNVIYGKDGILTRAISILSILTGAIAVIVIVIAGINMTLSQGDSGKVAKARSQIIYASIGLAVAALAQAIVQLVLNRIG